MEIQTIAETRDRTKFDLGFAILLGLIIIKFVNVPRLGGMPVAPINLLILLSLLFMLLNIKGFISNDLKILGVFLLFILYIFIKLFIEVAFHGSTGNLFGKLGIPIRTLCIMATWLLVCNTKERALFFIKLFVIMAAVSTVFGMLVYFWGGPFTEMRLFLNKTHASAGMIVISKGSNLAGFHGLPHIWGYMLAGVPILAVTLYMIERKMLWLFVLTVFIMGLFLNAERSALLMNMVIFLWWFLLDRKRIAMKLIIFSALVTGLVLVPSLLKIVGLSNTGMDSKGSIQQGTLNERMSGTSVQHAIDRIFWQYYGVKSVIQNPLIGPTHEDYLRNVHSLSTSVKFLSRYSDTPYPHNHYITFGMKIGIAAWIIIFVFLILIRRIDLEIKRNWQHDEPMNLIHLGIKLALIAVLGNALLHNAGILSFEFATCSMIAMFLSLRAIRLDNQGQDF